MSVARISLKNIDYFKLKKLVIDGNRDDYDSCSKEVRALCDSVQTLKFRDEEFDSDNDRSRFYEICVYYKQILMSKRIDPLDIRIKSGWWGDHKNAYSAGKLKPAVLKETLLSKAQDWYKRQGASDAMINKLPEKIDGPGLWVLTHKDHQCFQYVGQAEKIFPRVAEKLKMAYEGTIHEPLAALLIISMATDWDFYFQPVYPQGPNKATLLLCIIYYLDINYYLVTVTDDERVMRVLENDLILKHDSIWPHGLNSHININSLLEVSEFRKSCIRHSWPPESDSLEEEDLETINLTKLRKAILDAETEILFEEPGEPTKAKPKEKPAKERPAWNDNFSDPDRPPSPSAVSVASTHLTSASQMSSSSEESALSSRTITLAGPTTKKGLPNAASGRTVTRPQRIDSPRKRPASADMKAEVLEETNEEVATNGDGTLSAPASAPTSAPSSQTTSPTGAGLQVKNLKSRTPSASSVSSLGDQSQPNSRPSSPRKPAARRPATKPGTASPARASPSPRSTPRPTSAKSKMPQAKR